MIELEATMVLELLTIIIIIDNDGEGIRERGQDEWKKLRWLPDHRSAGLRHIRQSL